MIRGNSTQHSTNSSCIVLNDSMIMYCSLAVALSIVLLAIV
jgi:hypothetical protein